MIGAKKPLRLPLAEYDEARRYYEAQRFGLSAEFADEVEAASRAVQDFPHTWPRIGEYEQRHLVRRFPYGIVYREDELEIVVLSIMHLRRDPNTWKGRG